MGVKTQKSRQDRWRCERDDLEKMLQDGRGATTAAALATAAAAAEMAVMLLELDDVRADGNYWDKVSGKQLGAEGARKTRREEMEEIRKHGVYVKMLKK